ncbi:type I polyketide synthase [Actinosynnema sp. NPDC047251]|uniref:Polyketide synthase type I n=1 Tax=Saccharothrix espanaensis (strain ATCC 51144 / DSM 44229 / JCM 9112 / NBRC 15066 / NRRL 15764) TaxID=1179773 RepID=K0JXV7_SACES|nr:type I polyketide synthase [Saccharothrix espanaensis]CCH32770.1 Polyketide synthase type I [Saccharothrix espanaensis DSM 44229]
MEPIAIIGVGCRFPGADGPEEYWRLLRDGVDAISEVPPDRWEVDEFYDADPAAPGKMITRWGGFLDGVDRFDREFFGISPREASAIDPQQRLLLEVAWEALEDSGQPAAALAGSDTGVFVGISSFDYALLQASRLDGVDAYWGTGVALGVAANRISYALDLRGPSVAVDTACSSSLVALHSACQSLWSGQSRLALAGGVNLILSPAFGINFSKAGVMAPDGRCKTFDAAADGYVRGEGAGVVVLKPLERALADHDPIRAVIRGGAVAQDGRTNGLMAPNGRSQEDLLRAAHRNSGVASSDIDYVEAHGTGTALGDTMEAQALGNVLGRGRPAERPCVIGSVKSNIGHLEAAAGIAGVIKTVLMLEHREIPASLHVENPNPRIDFESLRLRVARTREPWPRGEGPVRAGVSSFGFGGTVAHVVLEEAPPVRPYPGSAPPRVEGSVLLPLSARSPEALRQTARRYLDVLTGDGGADLADLSYTAGSRRSHHRHRLAVVSGSRADAAARLRAFLAGDPAPGAISGDSGRRRHRRLVFVCSGQGPVWWPLDPELREEPALLAALEECDRLVRAEAGWSVLEQLWADEKTSRLTEPDFCQPALFSLQVALAALWRSRGVVPDAVVGHSMGEVAAAHLSGALGLEDAVRVICRRGRAIRTVSGRGRMAVVELPVAAVREELRGLEGRVSVAAVNAPTSTVISGDPDAVERVTARLEARGTFCRVLRSVDFASHSPQMDPLVDDLADALCGLRPTPPRLPMYSTVTGRRDDPRALDGGYWAQNIREPVLFAPAVEALLDDGHDVFVELAPHPGLLPAIAQGAQARGREVVLLPSLRRDEPPREVALTSLGALYALGFDPDWTALHLGPRGLVRLPGYPWQRERSWLPAGTSPHLPGRGGHPLLGQHLRLADEAGGHVWESVIAVAGQPVLDDHRVQGVAVLPGAAWLEMARAAAAVAVPGSGVVADVEFRHMLALADTETATLQLRVSTVDGGGAEVRAYAHPAGGAGRQPEWTLHMTGTIVPGAPPDLPVPDLDAVRARCPDPVDPADFYQALHRRGLEYGPAFRAVDGLWRGDREALAVVVAPAEVAADTGYHGVHPALLDAALQVLVAAFRGDVDADERPHVPFAIDRVTAAPSGVGRQDRLWVHARVRAAGDAVAAGVVGDVLLATEDGTTVAVLDGVHIRQLDSDALLPASTTLDRALYEVDWPRRERAAGPSSRSGGGWLVLADERGMGAQVAAHLVEDGERVLLANAGDSYDDTDPERLVIRPDGGDDVRRAVEVARERLGSLKGVAHLWSLDAGGDGPADPRPDALRAGQQRGAVSVLHLLHALARDAPAQGGPRLWLTTAGVHAVGGSSPTSVAHASVWGLGRVAAVEHPGLRPTLVDLDPDPGPAAARWLADELRADDPETQIAVRGGVRHVARLVRRAAPRAVPADVVRADATYLVTGGLGALGLLVGRWLVDRGARHLLLLGRRGADEAADRELRALREAGAEIHVARADVGDDRALAAVLADAAESMPPVRGVVHAAGVLDDATLAVLDPARLSTAFDPKAVGAWNLHTLTAGLPLDFFVLFSSLAGVLGSPGQGNYAAANTFLDALAAWRAARGLPALSIAWGPWQDTGLSVRPDGVGRFVERAGVEGITPTGGTGWLGLLFGAEAAQVVVGLVDWQRWAAAAGTSPLIAELVAGAEPDRPAVRRRALTVEDLLATEPAQRQKLFQAYLHDVIARALGLKPEQLDADLPLTEVGLDSLVAVGMKNQVEVEFGMSLPLAAALEGAGVRQLAEQMLAAAAAGGAPPPDDGSGSDAWEEFEVL